MKRMMGTGLGFVFFVLSAATASAAPADGTPGGGTGPVVGCASVTTSAPAYSGTYSCDLTLRDSLGRPQVGKVVTLTMQWCRNTGFSPIATATGITDATGRAFVTTAPTLYGANTATCSVNTPDPITASKTVKTATYFTSGMIVGPIAASNYAQPDATYFPTGLNAGVGRADLFRSGAYDKVLIIPEFFDPGEHSANNRNRLKFYKQMEQLILERYGAGWDVWLFQPNDTGQNLHEQAAELAQAIQYASSATGYGRPGCGGNKVSVFALSTAGVIGRIATARWEYDVAWRSSLGLASVLPVNLIATGDAPNYGMHLNLDMQGFIWDELSGVQIYETTNLDSCAATQLLRKHTKPGVASLGFRAFFVDGGPVSYYSKKDNTWYACAAGPAVATMNSANGVPGWPSAPLRVGYSNGASGIPNQCYGFDGSGTLDLDANGAGQSVCPYLSELTPSTFYTPTAGASWMHIDIDWADDRYWSTENNIVASDLEPGSRNPTVIATDTSWSWGPFGGAIQFKQRFTPTVVPWKSASGTEGPVGANQYAAVGAPWSANLSTPDPTDTWWAEHPNRSGVADVSYLPNVLMILLSLDGQGAICPSTPIVPPWL